VDGSRGQRLLQRSQSLGWIDGSDDHLKVLVEEKEAWVETLTSLWASADWFEREVWDMYGIIFKNHPNLKRILMYEEFTGHPLRKDYPVNKRQPLIGPVN